MSLIYLLLSTALISRANSIKSCKACLDGVCYSKTPILDEYRVSGQIAVDRTENIVYFHYDDSKYDRTAAFDLDDIIFREIPNIDFSFAKAVDQSTRDVYIGGANGIYKYNPITNITTPYGLPDKTIWHMQYKDKIYYTEFQTKGLYTIDSKQSRSITPLSDFTIDDFIIDNRDDIYFLSESKVYRLKRGANQAVLFLNDVYSLSVDNNERAHFIHFGKRGLYRIDLRTDSLIEVGAIGSGVPLKSAFDNNNNIIYTETRSRKLYYLMPNYGRCRVSSKSFRPRIRTHSSGTSFPQLNNSTLFIQRIS